MTEPTPPVDFRPRGRLDETTTRRALRAVLEAAHLLGLATGVHLRHLRGNDDPLRDLQARLEMAELQARLAWDVVALLVGRFAKTPERKRPYFTPAQRFRILEIKNLLGWSAEKVASIFLVCSGTILSWERSADPTAHTVGAVVQPTPPVRRAADVVRHLAQRMAASGFGGPDMISRVLARAGWRVSARSVSRYQRERLPRPAPPEPEEPARRTHPVDARFVHHTWMMDGSQIRLLLGRVHHVAAVFDAFSRAPLAIEVFDHRPRAWEMGRLFRKAVKAFGVPRYVITDRGPEFTGAAFMSRLRRAGVVQHRFASAENLYATARLERFWRTLKDIANVRGIFAPLTMGDLERRLEVALAFYLLHRPHEGLHGATPAEAFLGRPPAAFAAAEPPRARRGEAVADPGFQVEYLDADREELPVLRRAA